MARVSVPEPNILVLEGEIDLHESPRVREGVQQLLEEHPLRVFVDFTNVSYIDSSGMAVLIETMQRINAYGGKLAIFGLQDSVQSIFHIAQLDQVFRIFPDRAAARDALEG